MESFSADWLALREPADRAARSQGLTEELGVRLARRGVTRAIDIGCGAGSNVRYLLPRLPRVTDWTLVDHDAGLLDEAGRTLEPLARAQGVTLRMKQLDLADLDALPLVPGALITGFGLARPRVGRLAGAFRGPCREAEAHVLAVLNYDGRIVCNPPHRDDSWIRDLVNTHQRTDKGFGPALGPAAVGEAQASFGDYERLVSGSAWRLAPDAAALQEQLVDGWAEAARAIAPGEASRVEQWRLHRRDHIAARRSSIVVGHLDLAVFPDVFRLGLETR